MTPKEESEALLRELLPFAKTMLHDYGEFHPFGGMLKHDGEIVHIGATTGEDMSPADSLVEIMVDNFRRAAREKAIKAAAIVLNVTVIVPSTSVKSDAIEVRIDHRDGYSANVFFPYRSTDDQGILYEAAFASRGNSLIFGTDRG